MTSNQSPSKTINVIIVSYIPLYEKVGLNRRIEGLAYALRLRGWNTKLVFPGYGNIFMKSSSNMKQIKAYPHKPCGRISKGIAHLIYLIKLVFFFIGSTEKYSVIQLEHQYTIFIAPILKMITKAKIVIDDFIFVSEYMSGITKMVYRLLDFIAIRLANQIMTASLHAHYNLKKAGFAPLFVSNGTFSVEIPRSSSERHGFVMVGSLTFDQNIRAINHILEAARQMKRRQIYAPIIIVGGPNEIALKYQKKATQEGLSIVFTGYVSNEMLKRIYLASRVGLLPFFDDLPQYGGQRVKALEYLSHGLLLLAGPQGIVGINGLKNGENCIIAENPRHFSEHMVSILSNESNYNRIADNGKRLADTTLSWTTVTESYCIWLENNCQ